MDRVASEGPLVSVIIPTYNCGRYIVDAVESALAQREVSLEVIVVDDGSTEDTAAQLAPYRGRVRYLVQDNAGPGAARARGGAPSALRRPEGVRANAPAPPETSRGRHPRGGRDRPLRT